MAHRPGHSGRATGPKAGGTETSPVNERPRGLVLVAEDNSVNQKIILRMLQKLGYRADFVANGSEAVAAAARVPYDAVLMDCQMPEMDGFEATQRIRARRAEKKIPIIAMTAHALKGDRERCFAAGMDDYISKPVKLETIKELLEKWIPLVAAPPPPRAEGEPARQGPPCLDEHLLQSWRDLTDGEEDDFLTEVIDIFLQDSPRVLADLRQAASAKDSRLVQRYAHKLKGSSANLGAVAMAEKCGEIEALAAAGEGEVERFLGPLGAEYERVRTRLQSDWRRAPA
jgi:CheY-like chemotaxis protein/HPt (histidine-containing phosphotransfer) domain-containing protein